MSDRAKEHEAACDAIWNALENGQDEYHAEYGALDWGCLIEWLTEKERAAVDGVGGGEDWDEMTPDEQVKELIAASTGADT